MKEQLVHQHFTMHWENCRVLHIQHGQHCFIFQAVAEEREEPDCIMENRWETSQITLNGDRLEQSGRFEKPLGTGFEWIRSMEEERGRPQK